jgi:chemotaxis protein MotA
MKNISGVTLFGIFLGFGLFIASIAMNTSNVGMFFDLPSFLMVVGGTLAAAMVSFRGAYVTKALKELAAVIIPVNINPASLYKDVALIIQWAKVAVRDNIRDLEREVNKLPEDDEFLKFGTSLLVSNYDSSELRAMLTDAIETRFERHIVGHHILKTMAAYAPAFGMIGTLVGLIIMLDKLGGDPSQIGKGMSMALMTTLYGVLFSQLMFKPGAEKIKEKQEIMRYRNYMIMEGLIMLNDKQGAIAVQDRLNSFLDPKYHFDMISKKERDEIQGRR